MAEQEIDRFMAAIRRLESGSFAGNYNAQGIDTGGGNRALGAYQIMRSNWAAWAKEAGLPGADWRDSRAQDRVARHKFLQYYRRFGSWDLVAVAWFAGPGRAQTALTRGLGAVASLKDGNGFSVGSYVPAIRRYMGQAGDQLPASTPPAEEPQPISPSWVNTTQNQPPPPDPDQERDEMRTNLTDLLDNISSGIAGGVRVLPSLTKPELVGDDEQVDDGNTI